uniref:Uncharacterized protein n=1 Tax=Oryza barthii TaxID=65489 RepID=A0A0D3F7U2_9ORYZ
MPPINCWCDRLKVLLFSHRIPLLIKPGSEKFIVIILIWKKVHRRPLNLSSGFPKPPGPGLPRPGGQSTGGEEVGNARQERRRASATGDRQRGGGGNNKGEGETVVAEAAGVEEGVGGRRRAKQEKGRQRRANSRRGCISSTAAPHCGRVERAVEHWHQGGGARYSRQPVGEQLGAGDGSRRQGEELRMGGG